MLALVVIMLQYNDTNKFMNHLPNDQQTAQYLELQMRQWEQMYQALRNRERRRAIESTLLFVFFVIFLMLYFAK